MDEIERKKMKDNMDWKLTLLVIDEIRETVEDNKDHLRLGQCKTDRITVRNVQILEADDFQVRIKL